MSTGLLRPNNDSSGRTVKTYVWGLDLSNSLQSLGGIGGLLSNKITHVDSNQLFFFLYDANGNVTEMLNSEGVILANYFYDAFGNEISSSGNFSNENIFQMGTKIRNNFAGLVYYGYRFYSADFGRWINRDPIEELGNVNNCNFSANNLINRQDLLGLKCCLLTIEPRWKIGKNFSFAGHSMLECGDDPKDPSYMYISYFPGNKKHTRTQDEDDYGGWNFNGKNKTKTSKGFTITRDCLADCLDEKKVLEFYKKYQQADFPDWTKCSNNCSDTMTNAIIAALDNTKPVCPCGESLWDFMVREGINKSQIYNSPSDTRDAVQDIIRYNNCRRYACRKDTEMTTPGSERKPLPPPYFPKKD